MLLADEEHVEIGADRAPNVAARKLTASSDAGRNPLALAPALGSTEFDAAPPDAAGRRGLSAVPGSIHRIFPAGS